MTDAFRAELKRDATNFAICWSVEKRNGEFIRGTDHDEDITVPVFDSPEEDAVGTYLALAGITGSDRKTSSDMSVDNMETSGALPASSSSGSGFRLLTEGGGAILTEDGDPIGLDTGDTLIDINIADIESGLLKAAPVQVILVNWKDPSMGYMLLGRGFLGDITRDTDLKWTTEVRFFLQLLAQPLGKTYGGRCDVRRFGDARCKVDVAALAIPGTVTAATNRRTFLADLTLGALVPDSVYFNGGEVLFLTGANAGFLRQVKNGGGDSPGNITLWDREPLDIAIGDTFTITPGCDRSFERCDFFNNTLNFRGHGRWIPGIPAIISAP